MLTVLIATHNRPALLLNLLRDLDEQAEEKINVCVYDDASTEDYSEVQAFLKERRWKWHREDENHGKVRHGEFVGKIFADQRSKRRRGPFLFLPDDVRLRPNFFTQMRAAWDSIEDEKKVTLRVLVSEARKTTPSWTGLSPTQVSPLVDDVGFFDGAAYFEKDMLEILDYAMPAVSPQIAANKMMSSGMGKAVSDALHRRGRKMYRVRESLLTHVVARSQMHPDLRLRDSASAAGDSLDSRYLAPVFAALATMPERVDQLEKAVASLLPQVNHLYVYLNGHEEVPAFLVNDKITVARSQDFGNLTDSGKFFWADKVSGYYLACDDDIVYPPDYVEKFISHIEARERKAAVTIHGRLFPQKMPVSSYYRDKRIALYHNKHAQTKDVVVHVAGTGVLGFHTDTLKVSLADFKAPRMADVWFAIAAHKQEVPIICVRRPEKWLTLLPNKGIFVEDKDSDAVQTRAVNEVNWWRAEDPLLDNMLPSTGTATVGAWDREVKIRNRMAVVFPEWSIRDLTKAKPAMDKFVKQTLQQTLRPGGVVLDFGCGWGRWRPFLTPYGTYKGVDASARMVELAQGTPGIQRRTLGQGLPDSDIFFAFDVLRYLTEEQLEQLRAGLQKGAKGRQLVVFEVERRPRDLGRVQAALPWLSEAGSLRVGGLTIKSFVGKVC